MRWLLAWSFYWAGDAIWRVFGRGEGMGWRSYSAYQWCMTRAYHIQGDTDKGPWLKVP